MASVVKKNPAPEKKSALTAKEKKEARRKADAEALCWTQEPDRKRSEDGKEMTLHQYLTTPLHKKWGLEVKQLKSGLTHEQIGKSHKDKRLSDPCKEKTGNVKIKFCSNCRRKARKMQLKTNNLEWDKRVEKGEAGHHRKYRGKPTIIVKALEKVGEDPDKRIAQGEPIGQRLMEKLTKVIPEIIAGPAKASAKKPKAEKKGPAPKAAKEAAASMRKAMKKDKKTTEIEASYTEPTGSKVKQGPITKKPKGKKVNDKQETLGGLMAEAGMIKPDPGLMAAASQVPAAQVNQT